MKSVLACAFEAVLGAYFVEGKFLEIQNFLKNALDEKISAVDADAEKSNAKAILQEHTQGESKKTPVYKIINESGPSHKKIFTVEVSYLGEVLATAEGKTKKEAEQKCARLACEKLGVLK